MLGRSFKTRVPHLMTNPDNIALAPSPFVLAEAEWAIKDHIG